jgi:fumarylacetoacetase
MNMEHALDFTHDPTRRSWVSSARDKATAFPLQNLPFGAYRRAGETEARIGVAIGEEIVDLVGLLDVGLLNDEAARAANACRGGSLNALMALGRGPVRALRARLSELLAEEGSSFAGRERLLVAMADARMTLPATIGDYTDFYASVHHATNVGSMFRPDNPLLPNYKWIPVGYHGRASSIVISGTPIARPCGQTMADDATAPVFGPTRSFDYELEVGVFVGAGNDMGTTVALARAEEHMFGVCLVNDWSARDLQKWEYQPLGPFLAKNFATTISPWVVTMDALAPYRVPASERPASDPQPLPHLAYGAEHAPGGIALSLEVSLCSARMREEGIAPHRISQGDFAQMYWTLGQMLTHHASNGCNLRPGDLLASGTVSGPRKENRGCLLELTWRGTEPLTLPSGEQRRFLQDGDEIVLTGWCEREGRVRIGLGECRGTVASGGGIA